MEVKTIAEVYQAGSPFIFVCREQFPESATLREFAGKNLISKEISMSAFREGEWLHLIDQLIARDGKLFATRVGHQGAQAVADFLLPLCKATL